MTRYFNTKKAAERHLEKRRQAAYKRIQKKGWKVVGDNSFVSPGLDCTIGTKEQKWYPFLLIVTDEMIKDLQTATSIDCESELTQVLKK